jgi:cob(I)alamin adenosyltransferase
MGHRLSKIYTRKGDAGSTGMADGSRVDKDSLRMHAIGDVDELNSVLGLVINKCQAQLIKHNLITIQHDLFNLGGELALPDYNKISTSRIQWLEDSLDEMNKDLSPLKEFILPGGSECAGFCHLARTVCRRVERSLVSLAKQDSIKPEISAYINRLSDWLFVACRQINKLENKAEVYWNSDRITADTK